jgi:hypothetical protein
MKITGIIKFLVSLINIPYIIMLGLKSLNEGGAVYQGLKPENILGDIGVAKQFSNQSSSKKLKPLTTRAGTE